MVVDQDQGKLMWVEVKKRKYEDDEMKDSSKIVVKRDCRVCHKVFSSAKALGGHMRIHVDEVKNKDLIVSKNSTALRARHHSFKLKKQNPREDCHKNMVGVIKKPSCMICGREFPSMKSLFGHMRCHPERDWRGIRPPSTAKNSSDHSSSFSDADQDQIEVAVYTSQGNDQVVDLAESLRGWPVTARRGRKALMADSTLRFSSSSEEHDQLHKAVDDLMMLGRGSSCLNGQSHSRNIDSSEAASSNLPVSSADSGSTSNKPEIRKSSEEFRTNSQDCDSAKLDNIRKKRKKVKLSELEQAPKISPVTPEQQKMAAGVTANHRCKTHRKSFSSHQALGGHRASHNRLKIIILDSIGKSSCNTGTSLNPVEATQHEYCMVCNRNFPAAQAHGSHKMCGRSRPTSQPMPAGSRRVLNFDLNEVPPLED
ncbi:Zinc finger protein ZAT2 [Sesamum angolense]|uniref:Zinc finger protein ZAT2 n=1 Tax=Sesamum angolense TaxID=2727404 RepID=A0AAE1W579_9LAMI|nr:Zinc finger protein ZAT2 [Sesamum angolense]